MKKSIKVILAVFIVAVLAFTATACKDKNNEEITIYPAETKHISTVEDLVNVKEYLGESYKNFTFVLDNDIDLGAIEAWTPIGETIDKAFYGTFDGNGKSITNVKFNGWNSDGTPIIDRLGKDKGVENTASFSTLALFGYAKSATFKNLSVRNIDFNYYADDGYCYVSGLVAYSAGESVYENISVDGTVNFNNTYKKSNAYDDKGERQGSVYGNDVTLYVGGVNAYSNGNATFKNVTSAVDFNNEYTRAYLYNKDNAEPEEIAEGTVEERYIVSGDRSYDAAAASQIFVGGVCGVIKGGQITDASFAGKCNIYGKSVYVGGIAAAGYNGNIKNSVVTDINVKTGVHVKSAVAGVVALADNCVVADDTTKNIIVNSTHYSNAQSMSVGGIFAFACNASEISGGKVETMKADVEYRSATVGGVGGVLRDAKLSDSSCDSAEFKMNGSGITREICDTAFASVVNSVYNNSVLTLKEGAASTVNATFLNQGRPDRYEVENAYSNMNSTSYVDENGKVGVRFFEAGRTDKFVYVFGTLEKGALKISVYNEELNLITEATYGRTEGYEESNNLAEKYKDVYFTAGSGFNAPTSGSVAIDGRDMTKYEYRSGVPSVPEK